MKPSTVKRAKPADLWAGITPRQVYSDERFVGWGDTGGVVNQFRFTLINPWEFMFAISEPDGMNTKLLLKIKDQTSNLSVTLPELGKTTDMVFGLGRDILAAFRSLRSGKTFSQFMRWVKNPNNASKSVARRWLEYNYGWIPTIMDIHGLSESLYRRTKNGWIYVRVSDQDTKEKRISDNFTLDDYHLKQVMSFRRRARYKIASGTLKTLSETGISNPTLAAWELVPYSFVVDYFVNIGDWLSTFDALNGVSDLSWYSTNKVEVTASANIKGYRTQQRAQSVGVMFNRNSLNTTLTADFPQWRPNINARRLANLVALLRVR